MSHPVAQKTVDQVDDILDAFYTDEDQLSGDDEQDDVEFYGLYEDDETDEDTTDDDPTDDDDDEGDPSEYHEGCLDTLLDVWQTRHNNDHSTEDINEGIFSTQGEARQKVNNMRETKTPQAELDFEEREGRCPVEASDVEDLQNTKELSY